MEQLSMVPAEVADVRLLFHFSASSLAFTRPGDTWDDIFYISSPVTCHPPRPNNYFVPQEREKKVRHFFSLL